MSEQLLKFIIVCLSLTSIYLGVMYSKKNIEYETAKQKNVSLTNKLDSIQNINDSLHSILFPMEINQLRYEITLEILEKEHPDVVSLFFDVMSKNTE